MLKLIRNKFAYSILWLSVLTGSHSAFSQAGGEVNWLTFEQLEDSLKVSPKKVFVDFYADWCTYCHKMDKITFQDLEVAALLNNDYYAVRMNIETPDTVRFGNQVFVNERIKKPNPVHQIALLMASQRGKVFSLPAMVLLDDTFKAKARFFQYLDAEQMIEILNK